MSPGSHHMDETVKLVKCKAKGHEFDAEKFYLGCPFCLSGFEKFMNPIIVRPSWDNIWMDLAEALSKRSTCRRLSVGCVVVSEDNSAVLGIGYNGGAKG